MSIGAMIDNSVVAAVVSNPRLPDNPIVGCNAAFMELTGYSKDEIIGRCTKTKAASGRRRLVWLLDDGVMDTYCTT